MYPLPYPGYYGPCPGCPVEPAGTNGKAVGALVTSLSGLFCCGLPSLVRLIPGVIATRETRRTGQNGYGLAVAGVVIGRMIASYVLYPAVSFAR